MGSYDEDVIFSFKRTQNYTIEDFGYLKTSSLDLRSIFIRPTYSRKSTILQIQSIHNQTFLFPNI